MSDEELPVLDTDALKGYLMVESDDELKAFLQELVPVFTSDSEETFERLKGVLDSGSVGDIKSQAHSLKSCARNLALKQLAETCQKLESAAINNEEINKENYISIIEKQRLDAVDALTKVVS